MTKGIILRGTRTQLVVDARNVLDLENRLRVFRRTDGIEDKRVYDDLVAAHRGVLGAGIVRDIVDLTSRSAAGLGVKDDVDLFLLQRAEQRFGNGDRRFSAEEQERAFRAAELFQFGPQDMIGPGRRLRIGLEVIF